jgi:two-component system, NarL family, response regulator YdfI
VCEEQLGFELTRVSTLPMRYEPEQRKVSVLVIADSAIARAGLEAMLRESRRFDLIRDKGHSWERVYLRSLQSSFEPGVILADIADFSALLLLINHDESNLPVVLLVDDVSRSELVRAIQVGVRGILRRDAQPAEIFAAIEAAAAGLTVFGPDEFDLLVPVLHSTTRVHGTTIELLTTRETEILALMSQGLANKQISDRLAISEHTVKFHVSSILAKLGASSRTEAVMKGLGNGLVVI